ncbi:hypothetical protein [Spirosoma sp.]|uniref:hypothetical protein n=1 Tax=Spirosoma sp. TaxID=1899569 RepID=UPI003B3AF8FF
MLRATTAYTKDRSHLLSILISRSSAFVHWFGRLTIQLTALLVSLFYLFAVLEVDLGETGDSFGDVYDTYILSEPTQSPKSTVVIYRDILPASPVISFNQQLPSLPVNWSFVLALFPLFFYGYRPPKYRHLHLLHAIWRL